jgi:hypothetical protein
VPFINDEGGAPVAQTRTHAGIVACCGMRLGILAHHSQRGGSPFFGRQVDPREGLGNPARQDSGRPSNSSQRHQHIICDARCIFTEPGLRLGLSLERCPTQGWCTPSIFGTRIGSRGGMAFGGRLQCPRACEHCDGLVLTISTKSSRQTYLTILSEAFARPRCMSGAACKVLANVRSPLLGWNFDRR